MARTEHLPRLLLLPLATTLALAAAAEFTLPRETGTSNDKQEEKSCSGRGVAAFRCRSGGCVALSVLCDGRADCRDGSDESNDTCKKRSARATVERCLLPQQPPNGRYSLGGCDSPACQPKPGSLVEFALLNYTCDSGFSLFGSPMVTCDRHWSSSFPTCVQNSRVQCDPLHNPTRVITCYVGYREVSCSVPMEPRTKATVRCKTSYEATSDQREYEITCGSDGRWSAPILPCSPRCGQLNQESHIPWYAAVLMRDEASWRFACAASIVSPRVLISAGHCLWEESAERLRQPDDFGIIVGKYEHGPREKPTNVSQQLQVERIIVPEKFRGYQRRYAEDISIIILKNDIVMNEVTRPVCVDLDDQYSPHFIPGKIGILGSWGEPENETYTQKIVSVPIVDFQECVQNIPSAFVAFLTYDKFCAGYLDSKSVCQGDSGAGFANQFRDGKWYLTGVASVGVTPDDGSACDTKHYKGFTRLSLHRDFIRKNLPAMGTDDGKIVPSQSIPSSSCTGHEFECGTKECVSKSSLCDGNRDCSDGSDETSQECNRRRCPATSFRCKYGACIDRNFVCNGVNECVDGSDEESTVCAEESAGPASCALASSRGCALPQQPNNGRYTLPGCTADYNPGTVVSPGVLLNYSCNPGFELSGASLVGCRDGWSSPLPSCDSVSCEPLKNPSRDIECVLKGQDVDCVNMPVPLGTRAQVKCKIQYESIPGLQTYDMICETNGRWSRELQSCIPKCGVPNPRGVPFVGGGRNALLAELPWHVGLYQALENGTVVPSCGGSIVSSRVVVSAAHCFWKNGDLSFDQYQIVAGKYYYAWKNKTKYVQHLQIQEVVLPKNYKGPGRNYANDIAVIILKYDIQINEAVRPVCMDYDQTYLRYFSPVGTIGSVTGWGLNENQTFSEVLNVANLQYVDIEECERNTPQHFHAHLANDKFCAGNANKTTVCPGDSGGGYAVAFRDSRFYLVGVVSTGPSETCALYPYAAFTNVFHHLNFVREYVYKYV